MIVFQTKSSNFMDSSDEIYVEIGKPPKPEIYEMERSPLLQKAAMFREMMNRDIEVFNRLMEEPGRAEMLNIEKVNEDKPFIQMEILGGVVEAREHEFAGRDDMVLPPKGSSSWFSAGSEK